MQDENAGQTKVTLKNSGASALGPLSSVLYSPRPVFSRILCPHLPTFKSGSEVDIPNRIASVAQFSGNALFAIKFLSLIGCFGPFKPKPAVLPRPISMFVWDPREVCFIRGQPSLRHKDPHDHSLAHGQHIIRLFSLAGLELPRVPDRVIQLQFSGVARLVDTDQKKLGVRRKLREIIDPHTLCS